MFVLVVEFVPDQHVCSKSLKTDSNGRFDIKQSCKDLSMARDGVFPDP